jgi:nitrogen-specific signal transduction histidine kinase
MQTQGDQDKVWRDLASLIGSLPVDDSDRYHRAVKVLVHDLRQNISIIHGAEALLRRSIPPTEENIELLDTIRVANQRAIELVSGLAQHFDRE